MRVKKCITYKIFQNLKGLLSNQTIFKLVMHNLTGNLGSYLLYRKVIASSNISDNQNEMLNGTAFEIDSFHDLIKTKKNFKWFQVF